MPSSHTPVPGTVQLIDTDGTLNLKHGRQAREIVLVPQPTSDPEDPLRWNHSRKLKNAICAMGWCFFVGAIISGLSPAYILIEKDTGVSIADLSTGNGILFLFLGFGTLISQPLALAYGRRIVLITSILITTGLTFWTAFVNSRAEFFINRILLGISASPQETLIEIIIADIFFTHDRGFYMGAYSWTLFSGAFLSPVVTGYVAQELGWRWIQYILTMVSFGVLCVTFFLFEETMFYRDFSDGHHDAAQMAAVTADSVAAGSGDENEKGDISGQAVVSSEQHVEGTMAEDVYTASSKTYKQKLRLWGYHDQRPANPFKVFFLPFKLLFTFPTLFFSGILVGGILAWYNVVGGSLALILGNPPYNFTANKIGLTYLASVAGVTIGSFLSGWMTDLVAVKLARRNGGIMEPEARLWMATVALIVHPAGCLLYGVGASYHIHWIGVVFGLGLISVTLPMGSSLAFTYVLDSYKELSGEAVVSVILVRNSMGFAFGYAVVPMISNLGLRYAFVLITALGFLVWSSAILMIYVGKPIRRFTAQKYWNLVEKHDSHVH
ncbi:major facilitator superfamily domain-containing protein [Fusarium acuminatum]|uniref:Major facilitator superfamily domain-containing protein n=1 Tax=Fusarium acuminatum TaxID=5515 RepID=A0ABZ2X9Q9_9HYPO